VLLPRERTEPSSAAAQLLGVVGNGPGEAGVVLLRLMTARPAETQQWLVRAEGSLEGTAAKDETQEAGGALGFFARAPAGDVANTTGFRAYCSQTFEISLWFQSL